MSTENPETPSSPDERHILSDLQDNFKHQQAKIETLRDLVRKSETTDGSSSAHEKVKNITQRLTEMKYKVRSRHKVEGSFNELKDLSISEETQACSPIPRSKTGFADTPGNEKIQLLRRQVEESKIKMAERENTKREIEERVTQLKAKFDSTQQSLERSSELGRSMGDLSTLNASNFKEKIKSSADLSFSPLNLDKEKIKFLENRIKILEKQVEKQLNMVPTTESADVNLLRQQILELEENLRAKESIIEARTQAVSLMSENFNAKTATTVGSLEDTKAEMRAMQEKFVDSESELRANIEILQNELKDKTNKVRNLEEKNEILETARFELTVKNSEMESKLQGVLDYSTKLDELNKLNEALQHKTNNLEEQLMEKTVEYNVLNANFLVLQEKVKSTAPKSLFSKNSDEETEMEINRLKEQLDESNKSMIKIKLKCKQLQKQVDKFSKISDAHNEAIKLAEENEELQARIIEQASKKENLLFDPFDSGTNVASAYELELLEQIKVLEKTCENQNVAIKLLEEQKLELQNINQRFDIFAKERGSVNDAKVDKAFQTEPMELQEQSQRFVSIIDNLSTDLEKLRHENESLRQEIQLLESEKCELRKKADHYVVENMELMEKVEKLSKSSSSAESIEIVERLTQQEKLEMEELDKKISLADGDCLELTKTKGKMEELPEVFMGQELSDSLVKLREESSELMHRIELFTRERREVLEKMEVLSCENQELKTQIMNLKIEKSVLGDNLTASKIEIISLEEQLDKSLERIRDLETSLKDNEKLKEQFEDKMKSLTDSIPSSCIPGKDIIVQWKQSLTLLQLELENYRKSTDKSSRLNASKKLAKEAKNVGQQFSDFIEICLNLSHISGVTDSIEVNELKKKCMELDSIILKLSTELKDLKTYAAEKDTEINELNSKLNWAAENMKKCKNESDLEVQTLKTVRQKLEAKVNAAKEEVLSLNSLLNEQKQQFIDAYAKHDIESQSKDLSIEKYKEQIERLHLELRQWQTKENQSETRKHIKELENAISAKEKLIAEQSVELKNKQDTIEALNGQIMDLYRLMEDNSCKLVEKEDEISYLQELIDTKKAEIDSLATENEAKKKFSESLLAELQRYKGSSDCGDVLKDGLDKIRKLEEKVVQLEGKNSELESKNQVQVEKLKKFAANLKKKSGQCLELEAKLQAYNNLETSFLEKEIDWGTRTSLLDKIQSYKKEIEEASASIKNERDAVIEKNEFLSGEITKMQSEVDLLKNKLKYFENSIYEVDNLVESIRLDMANTEIELERLQEKEENSRSDIDDYKKQVDTLSERLKNKNLKFEKSKVVIKEKNIEIQRLKAELENVQNLLQTSEGCESCRVEISKFHQLQQEHLRVLSVQQNERDSLLQEIDRIQTLHNGALAKDQEKSGYIESLELENNAYKEKIIKLESCIGLFEERRQSLERHSDLLDEQLQRQTNEYERNEDALIYRLNMLLDHDDVIGRRLIETQEKKEELLEKLEQSQIEVTDLQLKLSKLEKELETFKNEKFREMLNENESLQQQLKTSQMELNRQQNVYEGRLAQKHSELDDLENELSIQLNKINDEKRKLLENLEKSLDEINELKDENVKLKECRNSLEQIRNDLEREITWIKMQNENMKQDQFELQELRMQSMHDRTDIDNLKQQLEALIRNHEIESTGLRKQIEELQSVRMQIGQNQTDDQVFIENENRRLKELLAEKEAAVAHYQQENLKLQMMGMPTRGDKSADDFPSTSQVIDLNIPAPILKEELFTSHEMAIVGTNTKIQDMINLDKRKCDFEDLEKYASDLEKKLKEQAKRYEKTINEYEKRLEACEIRHKDEIQKNVELMIVSDDTIVEQLPSLDSFFSKPQQPLIDINKGNPKPKDADKCAQAIPVQEELIVPQKAYILYPEATAVDEGEGWSCGAEEALLEEKHHIQMLHLNSRINELCLEKARTDEKIIELQIKCGKAMKKLKEYKARVEKAELEKESGKSSSIDCCDLDMAIQDELKLQVNKLEECLAESKKQHEKDMDEKTNLLKKVDSLTSANARLIDIKECQDIKIEGLQVELRQLIKKLEAMENWNAKGTMCSPIEKECSMNELSCQTPEIGRRLEIALQDVEDARIDKDELQALLDDEKNNAIINEIKIKELADKIATLENANCSKVADLEFELRKLHNILLQKEAEIDQSNVMNQNFQLQLNEYLATINQISSEMEKLKCELENMQVKYNATVSENTRLCEDVREWKEKNSALHEELNTWKSKGEMMTETASVNTKLEEKVIELSSQMHFKEAEILQLKQKIQNLLQEDSIQLLREEVTMKNQEIVQLHSRLQELETEKQGRNVSGKKPETEMDEDCSYAKQLQPSELSENLNDLKRENRRLEAELRILNDNLSANLSVEGKLGEVTLELNARNAEICQLKTTLANASKQILTLEKVVADNNSEDQIAEINRSWERIVEEKCGEIADRWRQYLEEKETEYKKLESNLILEIEQIRAGIPVPQRKVNEIEIDEGVESDIYLKMQAVLEQQELEIVTLKEQLAMRSAEYARLASRHDPYALSTSSNASIESNTQKKMSNNGAVGVFGSDQSSTVAKSELDLALYMLHQRDMRCEELTLELVNLLEERDTLQLKLSNSLRQIEEIKQKLNYSESTSESDQVSSNSNSPEKSIKMKTSHLTDDDLQSNSLNSKISQLQNVGYAKDKFIREEREGRQRQMEKIQQDVAKIPSEAVSELIGSNLASNMQSPSNALLDWLWGKNSSS